MLEAAAAAGPVAVAIAAAQELRVLAAASEAQRRGIIQATLIGDVREIHWLAEENHVELGGMHLVHQPDPVAAADQTMRIVAQGSAQVAVKGQIQTSEFLHAALRREAGLRTQRLISHVGVFEVPGFDRLLLISDGGVILYPTKEQKIEIVSNAIAVARALGVERPKVALLAAADQVVPQLPATVEIAEIVALQDRWQAEASQVDGPLLLDTAVSPAISRQRGRNGLVAGHAEVLIGPDVESVNIMAKAITYLAGGRMAGLVVGARAPLVVGSRADPRETRLVCIAAGALFAARADSQVA
jgi:phosphate butyryltransferase